MAGIRLKIKSWKLFGQLFVLSLLAIAMVLISPELFAQDKGELIDIEKQIKIEDLPGNDVVLTLDGNREVEPSEADTEDVDSKGFNDFFLTFKYSAVKNKLYIYNHGEKIFELDLNEVDLDVNEFIDNLEEQFNSGDFSFFDYINRPLDSRRIKKHYEKNYEKIQAELDKELRASLSINKSWDGGGLTNNWSEAANWDDDTLPDSGDVVGFDSTSSKDCNIDINIDVKGLGITSDYGGTVTQNSGSTITIGSKGFEQNGGTLILSDIVNVTGDWTYVSGTLTPGNSTVIFGNSSDKISGSHSLNNVSFITNTDSNRTWTINSGDTLTVNGNLVIQNSGTGQIKFNKGTIAAKGDITTDGKDYGSGSAILLINGSENQAFTVNNGSRTSGSIPEININKSGGTLTFVGTIRTENNWTYTAGTIDAGSSTIVFGDKGKTITGSHTLNNVIFDTNNDSNKSWTIEQNTILTVAGTLTLDNTLSGDISLKDGTIAAQGDIVIDDGDYSNDATILINGSGNQTFTSTATRTMGALPRVHINKPSGTLSFSGSFVRFGEDFTYTAGTFNFGSTVPVFGDGGGDIIGNITLEDVIFDTNNSGSKTWEIINTLTVTDDLTIDNTNSGTINIKGIIEAQGNVTTDEKVGSNGTIKLTGSNNQTVNISSLPSGDFIVNKTGGTATLANDLTLANNQDLIIQAGTLDQGTSYNIFCDDLTIQSGGTLKNFGTGDLTLDRNLTNDGTINFDGGGSGIHDTDPILIRSSSDGTQRTWSGTGTFSIQDVDIKDQSTSLGIQLTSSTDSGNNTGFTFASGNQNPNTPTISSATLDGKTASTDGTYIINEGQKLIINFQATDDDATDTVTLSTPTAPTVGTFTASSAANPGTGNFTFTPTGLHVGMTYIFEVRSTDNNSTISNSDLTVTVNVVNSKPGTPTITSASVDGKELGTGGVYAIKSGQKITIDFSASDSNSSDKVTLFTVSSPKEGRFNAKEAANPGEATYTLQGNVGLLNTPVTFSVGAKDDSGAVSDSNLSVTIAILKTKEAIKEFEAGLFELEQEAKKNAEANQENEETLELDKKVEPQDDDKTSEENKLGKDNKEAGNSSDQADSNEDVDNTQEESEETDSDEKDNNDISDDIGDIPEIEADFPDVKEPTKKKGGKGKKNKGGKDKEDTLASDLFNSGNLAFAGSPLTFIVPISVLSGFSVADIIGASSAAKIIDSTGQKFNIKIISLLPSPDLTSLIINTEMLPKTIAGGKATLVLVVNGIGKAQINLTVHNTLSLDEENITKEPVIDDIKVVSKGKNLIFRITGKNFIDGGTVVSLLPSNGLVLKNLKVNKEKGVIDAIWEVDDDVIKRFYYVGVRTPFGQAFGTVVLP